MELEKLKHLPKSKAPMHLNIQIMGAVRRMERKKRVWSYSLIAASVLILIFQSSVLVVQHQNAQKAEIEKKLKEYNVFL